MELHKYTSCKKPISLLRRQNMTIVFIHNLGYYNLKQNKDNPNDMIKLPNNNIHLSDNVLFKKPHAMADNSLNITEPQVKY